MDRSLAGGHRRRCYQYADKLCSCPDHYAAKALSGSESEIRLEHSRCISTIDKGLFVSHTRLG